MPDRNIKTIAITGCSRIGDLVVMSPFLSKLKSFFSGCRIILITWQNESPEFIKDYGYIDDIVETGQDKITILKNIIKLRRQNFDYLIHECPINTLGEFICYSLLNADKKVKYRGSREASIFEMWQNVFSQIGIKASAQDLVFPDLFRYNEEEHKKIDNLFSQTAGRSVLVGAHISSKKNWDTTSWETEKWAETLKYLYRNYNARIVLLGGRDEMTEAASLTAQLDFKPVDLIGRLSLKESALVMKKLDLFVCINSGLMNMASAMDVPLVCLSGPTSLVWRPFGRRGVEIRKRLNRKNCNPACNEPVCAWKDKLCMKQIEPRDVIEAADKILSEK